MHAKLYNEATLTLRLCPQTPLLIKAGRSGEEALDPTLPDMSFVRTRRADRQEPEIYIPGASLRGVLRSHAEKLLRSIKPELACDPTKTGSGGGSSGAYSMLERACFARESNTDKIDGPEAHQKSCYACKLFGNTVLAGRVRVGDLYQDPAYTPLLERRYGVAIDRVTGAVAQGPFELEILTDGWLEGRLVVRNYTLGQFGLLAGALLDLSEGLLPLGYGKSRGLGRVEVRIQELSIRTLRNPESALLGVGALATEQDRTSYRLPAADQERQALDMPATRQRGFYVIRATATDNDGVARGWLDQAATRWPEEVGA
jgi:CRISPR-associated protein Csm3